MARKLVGIAPETSAHWQEKNMRAFANIKNVYSQRVFYGVGDERYGAAAEATDLGVPSDSVLNLKIIWKR